MPKSTAKIMKMLAKANLAIEESFTAPIALMKQSEAVLRNEASTPNQLEILTQRINHSLSVLDQIGTREAFNQKAMLSQESAPLLDDANKRNEEVYKLLEKIDNYIQNNKKDLQKILEKPDLNSASFDGQIKTLSSKQQEELKNIKNQLKRLNQNIDYLENKLISMEKKTETAVAVNATQVPGFQAQRPK